jgi:hypothetical protein
LCCLTVVFLSASASASTGFQSTLTNNTGSAKTSVVLDYVGTGGTLANPEILGNEGPGNATIEASSSQILITWDGSGIANGNSVTFRFTSENDAASPSATWQPGAVAADPGDVTVGPFEPIPAPGLNTWGIAALLGLILATGIVVFRRRHATQ